MAVNNKALYINYPRTECIVWERVVSWCKGKRLLGSEFVNNALSLIFQNKAYVHFGFPFISRMHGKI